MTSFPRCEPTALSQLFSISRRSHCDVRAGYVQRYGRTYVMYVQTSYRIYHTTPHCNCFTALFRDYPGEPMPEENFWTSWCKGRLTEADTSTIWLGATPSRLTSAHLHHTPIFLQARCPSCRPTVSKHLIYKSNL